MYLDYFSLDRHPFRITPDPSLFFPGGQDGRGVILNALIYGITSGEGILKVTGEVGSGKTMLCRMLEEKLPDAVEIVYIANPRLTAREILYAIAIELKLEVTAATERLKVMHLLQDYLLARHAQGDTVVVFIEEAQSMPVETLEEIRLLSNLETHQHKLMQIVLFGQPELDRMLARKNIRQLRERITHSFRLEPLTVQATGDYLRYRLKAAGCPRERIFSAGAEKLIARASSGLTRRINILADKSLLAAYADSPSRQPQEGSDAPLVTTRHVKAAIRDSDYRYAKVSPWLLGSLGLVMLVVAVIVAMNVIPDNSPASAPGVAAVSSPLNEARVRAEDAEPAVAAAPVTGTVASTQPAVTAVTLAAAGETTGVSDTSTPTPDIALAGAAVAAGTETDVEAASAESGVEAGMDETIEGNIEAEITGPESAIPEPEPATAIASTTADSQTTAGAEARVQENLTLASLDDDLLPQEEDTAMDAPVPETAVTTDPGAGMPASVVTQAPVTIQPAGLAELRMAPTADWLRALDSKNGYTIQMFSVPSTNPSGLEEYLQFLQLVSLLDDTYICFMPVSSPTSGRWQVMHKEFAGVTPARNFINELPAYIRQYGPYVRNLNGIECSYPVETRN